MSKRVKSRAQELRKRKPSKAYEQGFGQNGGVSSLGTTYEDTDSDGVLDTIVKNSPRIGAFKRTVGAVNRSYLPQPAPAGPVDNPPTVTTPFADVLSTGAPVSLILPNHFTDPEGDPITYVVSSSDPTIATVAEAAGTLTVTEGTVYGTATITVTATANGKSVTGTFDFIYPLTSTQSLRLDGTNQYATLASTFTLSGNKSFTGWFYFDSVSQRSIFAPIGAASFGSTGFFVTNAGNVRFQIPAGRQTFTISNLSIGTWTHLAVTGDGTDLILYVNGSQAGSTLTDGDWSIGDFFKTATFYYFDGKADELAFFASTLSSGEVSTIANTGAASGSKAIDLGPYSPLHWWRLGEGATWDGTNWAIPDAAVPGAVGIPMTTINVGNTDIVTDAP
jgi:hypothetical protein